MQEIPLFRKPILLFACLLSWLMLSHSVQAQITSFPWTEGFENGWSAPVGWTQQQISGTTDWWFTAYSGTPSTPHSGSYKAYLYSGAQGATNKLITPRLELNGLSNPILSFWHTQQIKGTDQDTLRIYYRTSSAAAWALLQTYSNNIADWIEEEISLPNQSNDYYIAFEGKSKSTNGIQLDDISVFNLLNNNAATTAVSLNLAGGSTVAQVGVTLKNVGSNTIHSMVVKYQLNSNTPVSETYSGNLTYKSDTNFIFTTPIDISVYDSYVLKVWTELSGDGNLSNDTTTFTLAPPTSTYNIADKEALRNFLRQAAPSNNTEIENGNYTSWNGAKLGLTATDTTHWKTHETWITALVGLTWDNSTPKRLTQVDWSIKNIAGNLNLNPCDSLTRVSCSNNQIANLNLEQNTKLGRLMCSYNRLSNLDVTQNTKLTSLECDNNQLANLNTSNCTVLSELYCSNNQLSNLDLTQNTKLTYLECDSNRLSNLDVNNCTALKRLYCFDNHLTNLNTSNCNALKELYCYSNQLTNLDLTKNTKLTDLLCSKNQLSNLDVTQNKELTYLGCSMNKLNSLDVTRSYQLTDLNCSDNQLTNLNVTENIGLTYLRCDHNQLKNLDVTQNPELTSLHCYSNQLSDLNVTENTKITSIYCYNNQLTNLDVTKNIKLT